MKDNLWPTVSWSDVVDTQSQSSQSCPLLYVMHLDTTLVGEWVSTWSQRKHDIWAQIISWWWPERGTNAYDVASRCNETWLRSLRLIVIQDSNKSLALLVYEAIADSQSSKLRPNEIFMVVWIVRRRMSSELWYNSVVDIWIPNGWVGHDDSLACLLIFAFLLIYEMCRQSKQFARHVANHNWSQQWVWTNDICILLIVLNVYDYQTE